MTIRAYEFNTSNGQITQRFESKSGDVEKVAFLSTKPFKLEWVGPGGANAMSGHASATKTDVTMTEGNYNYKYGWFAICRDPISVTFTLKAGATSNSQAVAFQGLPTWVTGAPRQEQGLDGRVIVQRPGVSFLTLDIQSLAIGFVSGVAVTAVAFYAWSTWLQ